MYTYYSKHEIEEHMLYAEEIANILGIMTYDNKLHEKFIHAYLKAYIKENEKDYTQLYFMNRYGSLKKVYSQKFILVFISLFKQHMQELNKVYNITVDEKTYKVKRNGDVNYA